jgi:hypothetical protein
MIPNLRANQICIKCGRHYFLTVKYHSGKYGCECLAKGEEHLYYICDCGYAWTGPTWDKNKEGAKPLGPLQYLYSSDRNSVLKAEIGFSHTKEEDK